MAAKRSKIAELVVGFVVQGAKQALSVVRQTVGAVASAAKYVAGIGAFLQGGILFKAAEGTQEAYEFGKAFEYLVRVIGQAFAPYLRMITTVIIRLAMGFRSLSPETQRWIAVIGIAAVVIAGIIALAPVLVAAWTAAGAVIGAVWAAVVAAIGLIFSPIGLVVLAIAGVIAAFVALFDYMTGGSADAANGINEANASWVERAITWVQKVATAFGKAFNWMMQQAAKASNWIARQLADLYDSMAEVFDKDYAESKARLERMVARGTPGSYKGGGPGALRDALEEIKPFQLDMGKVDIFFNKLKAGARGAVPAIKGVFGALQGLLGEFLNPSDPKGFTLRMKVELEGLQGTYDRLLKAFADGDGEDIQKQILEQNKGFNEKLDQVKNALVNGFDKLGKELGVIGP